MYSHGLSFGIFCILGSQPSEPETGDGGPASECAGRGQSALPGSTRFLLTDCCFPTWTVFKSEHAHTRTHARVLEDVASAGSIQTLFSAEEFSELSLPSLQHSNHSFQGLLFILMSRDLCVNTALRKKWGSFINPKYTRPGYC